MLNVAPNIRHSAPENSMQMLVVNVNNSQKMPLWHFNGPYWRMRIRNSLLFLLTQSMKGSLIRSMGIPSFPRDLLFWNVSIIVLHSSVVIRPSHDCLCSFDSLGIFKLFRYASMESEASAESFVLYRFW